MTEPKVKLYDVVQETNTGRWCIARWDNHKGPKEIPRICETFDSEEEARAAFEGFKMIQSRFDDGFITRFYDEQ